MGMLPASAACPAASSSKPARLTPCDYCAVGLGGCGAHALVSAHKISTVHALKARSLERQSHGLNGSGFNSCADSPSLPQCMGIEPLRVPSTRAPAHCRAYCSGDPSHQELSASAVEVDAIAETKSGKVLTARGHLAKVTRAIPGHSLEMKAAMGCDGLS